MAIDPSNSELARSRLRVACAALAAGTLLAAATVARAEIENEASAAGAHDETPVRSGPAAQAVPVAPPAPSLAIVLGTPVHDDADGSQGISAGDLLRFRYRVTNDGNISVGDIEPVDAAPTFGGTAGQNGAPESRLVSGSGVLEPGQSAEYEAVYTLAAVDVYRAAGIADGVAFWLSARGSVGGTGESVESRQSQAAVMTVAAAPALSLEKSYAITTDNGMPDAADPGDVITYSYVVTNSGNVAVENVAIEDVHEGEPVAAGQIVEDATLAAEGPLASSADGVAGDGKWDRLGPGAVVRFTYVHTVTQAEFDAQ